jgi:hypothetical protein
LSSDRTRGYGLVDQASGGSPSEIFVSCDAGVWGLKVGVREEQRPWRLGGVAGGGVVRVIAAAN